MDATLKAVRIGGIEWRGLLREDYIKRGAIYVLPPG